MLAFLEGTSLIVLVFVAVPLKHLFSMDELSKILGPIHGALFVLFILNAIGVATEYRWQFRSTTFKVMIACIIPFGTFYIDRKILRPTHLKSES